MKTLLTLVSVLVLVSSTFAEPKPANGRTIEDINVPTRVLRRAINPWFFESLRVSPVESHVVVRAQLVGHQVFGPKIVVSDAGGAYDALALQRASELKIMRHFKLDTQIPITPVALHLLIYQIADGTLALSFASLDGAGDDQLDYFGCSKMAVLMKNGQWTEIKGPARLQNKGMMVRATGGKNDLQALYMMEGLSSSAGGAPR